MDKLKTVNYRGMMVLTTKQLAEIYGVEPKLIARNFERNRDRYTDGEHYIVLADGELSRFKAKYKDDEKLKYASILYLWTAKGCFLHAKSLNTDKAWSIYDEMVSSYFEKNERKNKYGK